MTYEIRWDRVTARASDGSIYVILEFEDRPREDEVAPYSETLARFEGEPRGQRWQEAKISLNSVIVNGLELDVDGAQLRQYFDEVSAAAHRELLAVRARRDADAARGEQVPPDLEAVAMRITNEIQKAA